MTTTSTPLTALNLAEERPGRSDARLARVRDAVLAGTYLAPAELVAEALLASSLLGPVPNPIALGWACAAWCADAGGGGRIGTRRR